MAKSNDVIRIGVPFLLVSTIFLAWGLANNMNDTLLAAFRRIMSMSDLQTSMVQFAFFGAYACVAFPAAMFIRKYSFKSGIILGLLLYACGTMLFIPQVSLRVIRHFFLPFMLWHADVLFLRLLPIPTYCPWAVATTLPDVLISHRRSIR